MGALRGLGGERTCAVVAWRIAGPSHGLHVHALVGQDGKVHPFHACWAGEGPHEPVVDALDVVVVHAREEPDSLPRAELHHAYCTPDGRREGGGRDREV